MAQRALVRQGCLFARPTGAIDFKIPQEPAGLIIRNKTFADFSPVVVKDEKPVPLKAKNTSPPQATNPQRCSRLPYPRLISFEINRGGGSTRQGWRKERCQPRMAVCATHWSDYSQNAAGTLGLIIRNNTFRYFSPVVVKGEK